MPYFSCVKGYLRLDSHAEAPGFMSEIQNSSVFAESASLVPHNPFVSTWRCLCGSREPLAVKPLQKTKAWTEAHVPPMVASPRGSTGDWLNNKIHCVFQIRKSSQNSIPQCHSLDIYQLPYVSWTRLYGYPLNTHTLLIINWQFPLSVGKDVRFSRDLTRLIRTTVYTDNGHLLL